MTYQEKLIKALAQTTQELEDEINARYPSEILKYPSVAKDYEADMMRVESNYALLNELI